MEFSKFDGENPCLWKDRCKMYFEVFGVGENLKSRFAATNFVGAMASWAPQPNVDSLAQKEDRTPSQGQARSVIVIQDELPNCHKIS